MKPWIEVHAARTPEGATLCLRQRGDEYAILLDRKLLMSSRIHGSEEALGPLGCDKARLLPAPRVLIGGLGMGYTLRAALDVLPARAEVVVAELLAEVVDWNRGPLAPLARAPLRDRRVRVEVADVAELLRASSDAFDVILLDIDNSPDPLTQRANAWSYGQEGLAAIYAALRPAGTLAVWSASTDRSFERRLQRAGFSVETRAVRGREGKGAPTHQVFLAAVPKRKRRP